MCSTADPALKAPEPMEITTPHSRTFRLITPELILDPGSCDQYAIWAIVTFEKLMK